VRAEDTARDTLHQAPNREIEPPLELGLPYWFHLFFPDRLLTTDLDMLVIGCEDEFAARLARANPRARVTALEQRPEALESAARSREQRNLYNLNLVSVWPPKPGEGFDLIYCNTQSWPQEPSVVLEQAADLLRPNGSLHLTVRSSHAWTGVRTVRELLERLAIQPNAGGYPRARQLVAALGHDHPWNLLGPDPNIRPDDLIADWLRPEEPCFTVPEVYALLAGSGLALQRFTYQAYYLPQCSTLARTPLLADVRQLPPEQQHALMELYWPKVRYHLVVACRADRPAESFQTDFTSPGWLHYAPLLPAHLPLEDDASPVGAKVRLCWRAAGMPDLSISLGGFQYRLLRAVDRAEQLGEVVGLAGLSGDPQLRDEWGRDFFQLMADYDFLHFRTCPVPRAARSQLAAPGLAATPESTGGEDRATHLPSVPEFALPQEQTQPAQAGDPRASHAPPQAAADPIDPLSVQFERIRYEACPLCAEPGYQPFRQAGAEFPVDGRFVRVPIPWMRCRRCAHVFTAGYFAGEICRRILDASLGNGGGLRQAIAKRSEASRIVSAITTLRECAAGRWLDVGCSHSGLIAVAAEFGYDSVGLDYCDGAVERLRQLGYEVRTGSLFDCQDGPFDVISLSGVLDRIPFPAHALSHVHGLLAPRGLLFLSTPSSDSLSWRSLDCDGLNPYWARLDRYHSFHRKSAFRLLESTGFDPCSYGAGAPEPVGMEIIACKRAGARRR
jgi:SAM-dependent methyltransferase